MAKKAKITVDVYVPPLTAGERNTLNAIKQGNFIGGSGPNAPKQDPIQFKAAGGPVREARWNQRLQQGNCRDYNFQAARLWVAVGDLRRDEQARGMRPYIVGEEGPELFVPRVNGSIIPNHRLGSPSALTAFEGGAGGADSGANITINQNMPATATPQQAADAAGGRVLSALSALGV